MINHKLKFIYIHVDKTGGSSIASSISTEIRVSKKGGTYAASEKHWSIKKYNDTAKNSAKYKKYFKFAFVRNPWDRLVSKYFFDRKSGRSSEESFKNWAKSRKGLKPQLGYLTINDEVAVDFIGRYENLQEDFNIVCDKIGAPQQQLPHANKTKHKHYTKYYDAELREIIGERYAKDIEYFGYEFGE
jgi:chondroitin 4-sulfotransferase 11